MNATSKELARVMIDLAIAVTVPSLMVAAIGVEVYCLWWPTFSDCIKGYSNGPACGGLTFAIGVAAVSIITLWVIHAAGVWLQDCLHRRFHFLEWV